MPQSESNPKGYRHPGDYEIDTCYLSLPDGTGQEVKTILTELNIYQSLNKHYMECDIILNDAKGIIQDFDGIGILQITFKTTDQDEINLSFALYELSNKARLTDRQETYTLHGISEEAYITTTKKISRAFGKGSGNTIDKMISGLYKEFFKSSKKIDIDPVKSKSRFIVPNYTVDDAITFMCEEANSDSVASKFYFYENFDGYNFKDLNTLVRGESIETFKYNPMNFDTAEDDGEFDDAKHIISFAQSTQKNYLTRVLSGQFKSRTINIDLHRKNINEVKFDFDKQYKKFNTFAKKKFNHHEIDQDSVINLTTTRKGHDNDPIMSAEKHVPKKINEEKPFRDSYIENFMQVVNIKIAGDPTINVGDVINIQIPKMGEVEEDERDDKYVSGDYLISAARHHFNGEMYVTSLQCVRDAGKEL